MAKNDTIMSLPEEQIGEKSDEPILDDDITIYADEFDDNDIPLEVEDEIYEDPVDSDYEDPL